MAKVLSRPRVHVGQMARVSVAQTYRVWDLLTVFQRCRDMLRHRMALRRSLCLAWQTPRCKPSKPSSCDTQCCSQACPHSVRMALVAMSAATAEAVTFPIDFGKTRMQLHAGRQSFVGALTSAVQKEGLGGVYAGIQPAILRHLIYSSLRISFYEDLRRRLSSYMPLSASSALAGLLGGGLAQAVASPADRLKVMLVQEGGSRSMVAMFQHILREEGIKGLYRGVVINVQRAALVNLGELSTYDQAKSFILKRSGWNDGTAVHTLSACCSGFVASICATPADVIKSCWRHCLCATDGERGRFVGLVEGFLSQLGTAGALAVGVLDHL
eukprot:symbB.v1.2.035419.t1/scaffold4734.1/size35659/3